jgi:hypothetical protein
MGCICRLLLKLSRRRKVSRKMRIFPSVMWRLPFIVWVLLWAQTNIKGGSK